MTAGDLATTAGAAVADGGAATVASTVGGAVSIGATVPPGGETAEHYHRISEEIFLFVSGMGTMRLDGEEAPVRAGDCVVIAPGAVHKLHNPGTEPLVLLCCCAPAYSHDDTVLTGG